MLLRFINKGTKSVIVDQNSLVLVSGKLVLQKSFKDFGQALGFL